MSKSQQQTLMLVIIIIVGIVVGVLMNGKAVQPTSNPQPAPSAVDYAVFKKDLKTYADENFGGKLAGEGTKTSWYDNIQSYEIGMQDNEVIVIVVTTDKTTKEQANHVAGMILLYINSKTDGRARKQYAHAVIIKNSNNEILENRKNPIPYDSWKTWN